MHAIPDLSEFGFFSSFIRSLCVMDELHQLSEEEFNEVIENHRERFTSFSNRHTHRQYENKQDYLIQVVKNFDSFAQIQFFNYLINEKEFSDSSVSGFMHFIAICEFEGSPTMDQLIEFFQESLVEYEEIKHSLLEACE